MRKFSGSRDHNHDVIAAAFRALGCTVTDTERTGIPGWPDMVVGCMGANHLVEVKNPATHYGRAGMTADQSAFNSEWRGEKVHVITTEDEACTLVQAWRRQVARYG